MKKHVLLTLGLLLSSPLVLAQDTSKPAKPATPATPALPDVGAPTTPPEVTAPATDDQGNTTTGVRSQNGGLGATANKDKKTGTLTGEFAAMDANGDGSISRDEFGTVKGTASFEQLDKNHDGKLNAIELKGSGKGPSNDQMSPPAAPQSKR